MRKGSIAQIWMLFLAALTGIVIASLIGGSWPPPWVLATLVVPLTLTIVAEARKRGRQNERSVVPATGEPFRQRKPRPARGSVPRPDVTLTPDDLALQRRIVEILSPARVQWLRTNDFSRPWLSSQARPLDELRPVVATALGRPFAIASGDSLIALAVSLDAFADFYFAHTLPDPLMVGDEWRFFDWPNPDQVESPDPTALEARRAAATKMHTLAVAVADAYLAFAATVPDPSAVPRNGARPTNRATTRS